MTNDLLDRCERWFAAYMHDREDWDEATKLLAELRNRSADEPEVVQEPCEHLRSVLLAEKLSAQPPFEMRKCLDCTNIFRVRKSESRDSTAREPSGLVMVPQIPTGPLTDELVERAKQIIEAAGLVWSYEPDAAGTAEDP